MIYTPQSTSDTSQQYRLQFYTNLGDVETQVTMVAVCFEAGLLLAGATDSDESPGNEEEVAAKTIHTNTNIQYKV